MSKESDTFNVQFRAELFHAFNRVNYGDRVKAQTQTFKQAPAPLPQSGPAGSAGALTTTAGSSRQTQFALKIIFEQSGIRATS